jgi:hypothetical protein
MEESNTFPEWEIWTSIKRLGLGHDRKKYLRKIFLYGDWFEGISRKEKGDIMSLFSSAKTDNAPSDALSPVIEKPPATSAQSKLGNLMP